MNVRDLRQKYLRFFESKGHQLFPSGALVPYDVTGRLDESLLFNGAGMVQFKPYFRGVAEPPSKRLTTAQKCLRTGDIDEVGDETHLTFFEMMGNFSFGDYFKPEAIAMSWEFLTSPEWLGLDQSRLSFTVFEEDDVAFEEWAKHLSAAGIDPSSRIFRLGEETNYWPAGSFSAGPPGPCGPHSEMFYWTPKDEAPPGGQYTREDYLRDEAAGKWLEIWNDVFIQFEWQGNALPEGGYQKTGMPSLPFQSVDTGMGLERTAAVLGGFKSVYDTDAFQSIFRQLESLATGIAYGAKSETDRAMRIIADHLRAACFCIADGVLPANTGRGYVLRRLIRRAVLKGQRVLGFRDAFMDRIVDSLIEIQGDHYQELHFRREVIIETLKNEEAQFRRTLDEGSNLLRGYLVEFKDVLPGDLAFRLYDTYGFPLEVTQELCQEAGVEVDTKGYQRAMSEAQERSRGADQRESVYGGVTVQFHLLGAREDGKATPTEFLGYQTTQAQAVIVGAMPVGESVSDDSFVLALDQTPFYAESGGQVGDRGTIEGEGFLLRVEDVTKQDGVFVHVVEPLDFDSVAGLSLDAAQAILQERLFGKPVIATVNMERRREITRNHTATHLLHAALRSVLGAHVTQAGSLVAPDQLRFDFTHGKGMSAEEIEKVERIVNEHVMRAEPMVTYFDVPLEEARKMGAMALFGEKYADRVRVVQVGGMTPDVPSFSRELCGGIHVSNTGEIGLFKILHESSAASGVRRIIASTGWNSYEWVRGQEESIAKVADLLKSPAKEIVAATEKLLESLREEKRKRERLAAKGVGQSEANVVAIGSVELVIESMTEGEPQEAQLAADRLVDMKPQRVAVVGLNADGKLTFVCKVGDQANGAGAHAGNLVREIAKIAGGSGGGRPDFAMAGGKDASQFATAMQAAADLLRAQLS